MDSCESEKPVETIDVGHENSKEPHKSTACSKEKPLLQTNEMNSINSINSMLMVVRLLMIGFMIQIKKKRRIGIFRDRNIRVR